MTATGKDVFELVRGIRYDATAIQAKVTDLLNMLGELDLPAARPTVRCPYCPLELAGPRALAEHLHNVHDLAGILA